MRPTIRNTAWPLAVAALLGLAVMEPAPAGAAPPAAATLLAPAGPVPAGTLSFTWQAAAGATFYYLLVNDSTASPRFAAWYPADAACPGASATCTVVVTAGWAVGGATWWIQAWNPDGLGPWSVGIGFSPSHVAGAWSHDLPAGQRFQLVYGGVAVLDRMTGLVWQRTPTTVAMPSWGVAVWGCTNDTTGSHMGWRAPTIEELRSLLDVTQSNPQLPAGHPFSIVNGHYWSATTRPSNTAQAFAVGYFGTSIIADKSTNTLRRWCVRGGQPTQSPQ
jgi:hypothetical protein